MLITKKMMVTTNTRIEYSNKDNNNDVRPFLVLLVTETEIVLFSSFFALFFYATTRVSFVKLTS